MKVQEDSSDGEEEQGKCEGVLGQVVKDTSLYTPLKTPGPLQPCHLALASSTELFLLMLPEDVVNPSDLVNCEVVVGGKKESTLVVKGNKCRLNTYPAGPDHPSLPSLFLPNQQGELTKVNAEIKACMLVKGNVEEDVKENCVNIDALRSVHYKPPADLKERDFFSSNRVKKTPARGREKCSKNRGDVDGVKEPVKKRKKENISDTSILDGSQRTNNDVDSSVVKKKKKRKSSILTEDAENPTRKENIDDSLNTTKESETPTSIKKVKKENSQPLSEATETVARNKKAKKQDLQISQVLNKETPTGKNIKKEVQEVTYNMIPETTYNELHTTTPKGKKIKKERQTEYSSSGRKHKEGKKKKKDSFGEKKSEKEQNEEQSYVSDDLFA